MLIGNAWETRDERIEVRNPFDGHLVGTIPRGGVADVQAAIGAAAKALDETFSAHARYDVLMRAAD